MASVIASIIAKLLVRHSVSVLHGRFVALLSIRTHRPPWLFPSHALARLVVQARSIAERAVRDFRPWLRVEVMEAIFTAAGLLSAHPDVQTEG